MNLVERMANLPEKPPRTRVMAKTFVLKQRVGAAILSKDPIPKEGFLNVFGNITATTGESMLKAFDLRSGIDLKPGQVVTQIHLIPPKEGIAPRRVADSMSSLAEHIKENFQTQYIVGITYERLARASKRFGFTVLDCPISREKKRSIKKSLKTYQKAGLINGELGEIKLIVQRRDSFLERFGTRV